MRGYAMLKIGESGWIEKERPVCGPLDAICRPIAVAFCSSDGHTLWAVAICYRHNMILGHECCAEVVEVGSLVKDFKPGDRVLVPAITPDWSSEAAQAGWQQHSGGMLGGWKFSNYKDGVFAELIHVNDTDGNLAHLPEGMDPVDACIMSDMVPTGFHAVELADVQFGDTVLVIGIGCLLATAAPLFIAVLGKGKVTMAGLAVVLALVGIFCLRLAFYATQLSVVQAS